MMFDFILPYHTIKKGVLLANIAYEISQISQIPRNVEGIARFLVGFPWIVGFQEFQ